MAAASCVAERNGVSSIVRPSRRRRIAPTAGPSKESRRMGDAAEKLEKAKDLWKKADEKAKAAEQAEKDAQDSMDPAAKQAAADAAREAQRLVDAYGQAKTAAEESMNRKLREEADAAQQAGDNDAFQKAVSEYRRLKGEASELERTSRARAREWKKARDKAEETMDPANKTAAEQAWLKWWDALADASWKQRAADATIDADKKQKAKEAREAADKAAEEWRKAFEEWERARKAEGTGMLRRRRHEGPWVAWVPAPLTRSRPRALVATHAPSDGRRPAPRRT